MLLIAKTINPNILSEDPKTHPVKDFLLNLLIRYNSPLKQLHCNKLKLFRKSAY